MLPHVKRQIIYGTVYFLILVAVGFGIFSYAKNLAFVSCSDNEQNGQEQGVDCGGPKCTACEIKYAELPKVEWVKVFLISPSSEFQSENTYAILARVSNPNESVGTPELKYFYDLFGVDKKNIGSGQGEVSISPLEPRLLLVNFSSSEIVTRVELKLGTQISWQFLQNPVYSKLNFGNISFGYSGQNEQGFFKAEATLFNQAGVYFPNVEVVALALDDKDNILSVNQTFIDYVGVGDEEDFRIIWFDKFAGQVAKVRFEALVNEFNLIR